MLVDNPSFGGTEGFIRINILLRMLGKIFRPLQKIPGTPACEGDVPAVEIPPYAIAIAIAGAK